MALNELYPALQAAEKTTEVNPLWWVGHQTLGRARLGLGEVRMVCKKIITKICGSSWPVAVVGLWQ